MCRRLFCGNKLVVVFSPNVASKTNSGCLRCREDGPVWPIVVAGSLLGLALIVFVVVRKTSIMFLWGEVVIFSIVSFFWLYISVLLPGFLGWFVCSFVLFCLVLFCCLWVLADVVFSRLETPRC